MKSIIKRVIRQFPSAERFRVNRKYRVERKLLRGTHRCRSSQPSILHFSINKSATQYIKQLLRECGRENGLTAVDFSAYAFNQKNVPFLDRLTPEEMKRYEHAFREHGYFYSVFGGMVHGIPNIHNFRKLLVIRDPRDVLTSEYFSITVSHPLPLAGDKVGEFIERREWAKRLSIDEYVLARKNALAMRYQDYIEGLGDLPNVHVTRYEDMIADFPQWFEDVLAFCELRVRPTTFQRLVDANRVAREQKEDVTKHRRQMRPGDHRRKLTETTVEQLNADLEGILFACGYAERDTLGIAPVAPPLEVSAMQARLSKGTSFRRHSVLIFLFCGREYLDCFLQGSAAFL